MPKQKISEENGIIFNKGIKSKDEKLRDFLHPSSHNFLNLTRYPKVSIIIPTYNQVGFLKKTLDSVESQTTYKNYELILVTNNLDENSEMRRFLSTLKYPVLVFEEKYSWGAMNEFAIKKATGEFILFMNDDVEIISPNWLESLVVLGLQDDVAAVGPKLLFPNKKLQEAGCIIWKNGTGWNYGRNDDPEKPKYNFVREVDYCTACCLLVKKSIFDKVGGFDPRYEIGYAEDCDLCFEMAKAGFKTLYQPAANVIHYEGRTQGTDVSSNTNKSYQIENVKKFGEKWQSVLQSRNLDSVENSYIERNRKKGANILLIDHYIPEYDKDAGSLRTYYMMSILSYLGHKVTLWPDNLNKTEPYTSELQQKGIEVIYAPNNFESFIKEYGFSFHLCISSRPHISEKYIDLIRKYAPQCKIAYDPIDISYVREFREGSYKKDNHLIKKSEITKNNELELIKKYDSVIVTNNYEAKILQNDGIDIPIVIVSVLQITSKNLPKFEERKDLVFLGGFNHPPNVDSIEYVVNEIFPKLKTKIKNIKIYIIGSNPPQKIIEKCSKIDGVVFLGFVKDIDPYLAKTRLMLAPLRFGAGTKGKITQSLANGLPVITTSIGAEGIVFDNSDILQIGDEPELFVKKTIDLYNDKERWTRISENGLKNNEMYFSPENTCETLNQMIYKSLQ